MHFASSRWWSSRGCCSPGDFGLVGMVTAITGFMALFKDAGLSDATVQSATVNQGQLSQLFWVNVVIGVAAWQRYARSLRLASRNSMVNRDWSGSCSRRLNIHLDRPDRATSGHIFETSGSLRCRGRGVCTVGQHHCFNSAGHFGPAIGRWLRRQSHWQPSQARNVDVLRVDPSLPRRNAGARQMLIYGGKVTLNSHDRLRCLQHGQSVDWSDLGLRGPRYVRSCVPAHQSAR